MFYLRCLGHKPESPGQRLDPPSALCELMRLALVFHALAHIEMTHSCFLGSWEIYLRISFRPIRQISYVKNTTLIAVWNLFTSILAGSIYAWERVERYGVRIYTSLVRWR